MAPWGIIFQGALLYDYTGKLVWRRSRTNLLAARVKAVWVCWFSSKAEARTRPSSDIRMDRIQSEYISAHNAHKISTKTYARIAPTLDSSAAHDWLAFGRGSCCCPWTRDAIISGFIRHHGVSRCCSVSRGCSNSCSVAMAAGSRRARYIELML